MIRKITSSLLLLCSGILWAQTGSISGVVKTSEGAAIELVNIVLKGTSTGSSTDSNGGYRIENLDPGACVLVASFTGFGSQEKTVVVKAGETSTVDFVLAENIKELNGVVITSTNSNYNDNDPSQSLRVNTPVLELPQNVQIVTADVLKDQQVISMSDGLVRNASGLVRAEHWGDMYTNIIARGSQVQAFRNGFNVVNSYWGPLTEDMSYVERIEFVKGPAGFMLSSGDPSGLYNVVTKKPSGQRRGEASVTLGSFDLYRSTLDLDGKISTDGRLLYRLNLAAKNAKSYRPNEYNNRYSIAPVISYQLDSKTKLTAEYTYQRADMSNVGSFYVFSPDGYAKYSASTTLLPPGLPGTKINDHSTFLNIQHAVHKNWKVTAQVSRFSYNQEGSSMWVNAVFPDGKIIRNVSIWDSKSTMSMGQLFVNGDVTTGPIRHRVLAGLDVSNKEYMADWGQGHALDDTANAYNPLYPNDNGVPINGYPDFDHTTPLIQRATVVGGIQNSRYASFYLQDELGFFSNKLRLTLAGRYTDLVQSYYGTTSAQHFTPRVGLSASLNKSTAIYALYDQAFIPQSGIFKSGKQAQPITGNNLEVGVKRDWFGGKWNTTLAVYRIIKNNEVAADPTPAPEDALANFIIEIGQKQTQGIEFDLRGDIAKGLQLIANYALTDSRVTKVNDDSLTIEVGDVVPGFSKHTANAWLTYKIQSGALKGIGLTAGFTYVGGRATYWEEPKNPDVTLADYTKVDAGLFWENEKLKIAYNMYNVTNEYIYSGSYYGWNKAYYWQVEAPRNSRVTVSYKF